MGGKAQSILDCCDYKLFYSSSDFNMIRYLSQYAYVPQNEIQNMGNEKLIISKRGESPHFIERTKLEDIENTI